MTDKELVLEKLLSRNFEAYLAIPSQAGATYDVTVVLNSKCIARLKVVTRTLKTKSTNGTIKVNNRNCDFFVVMIVERERNRFFILSQDDVIKEKNGKVELSISSCKNGMTEILGNISIYENKWDSIKTLALNV